MVLQIDGVISRKVIIINQCLTSEFKKNNYPFFFSLQGNYVSARTYYERALQLVPDSKLLQENLAKLDRLEKRLQEVREKNQT